MNAWEIQSDAKGGHISSNSNTYEAHAPGDVTMEGVPWITKGQQMAGKNKYVGETPTNLTQRAA